MRAGELRERITFAMRTTVADDGYGNTEGDWQDQFTVAAQVMPLKGSEGVIAARLEGRQPVVVTVRCSSDTAQITTDWKATNARSGAVYNITAVTPDERGRHIDFLATSGIAT